MRRPDPQGSQSSIVQEQRSVSGPVLVLLGAALLGVLAVANAFVLDAAIGSFSPLWLGVVMLLEVALIAGVLVLRPDLRPPARWNGLEILGMMAVGGAFLAHAIHLAPADLMPVSFSVDNSHQHLLVNYIYENDRFPERVDYLYFYDDYPAAPSALAAFSARFVGVLPAQTMYLLAALFVTAQVMLVYGVSIELLPRRAASHVLAALASLSVFLVYPYSVRVFAAQFYSNMMMGDLIVLLTLWVVTVRDRLHPLFSAAVGIVLVFGCLNSYPAWLPFVIAPMLASMMLDRRMSMRRRLAITGAMGGITAVLAGMAIVDQWDFITWFAPVRDRRLIPGWASLGGGVLLLAGWGLVVLARKWRRLPGFALFLAIDLGLVAVLYGVSLLDRLALYIPDKTFYFNIFGFAVLTALGLNWFWEHLVLARIKTNPQPIGSGAQADRSGAGVRLLTGARIGGILVLVFSLVAVVLVNRQYPPPSTYPITLDEYRVAYQVSQEMPDAELTYLVRNGATFYWIYGCVLNHTHDVEEQSELWRTHRPTYESWMEDKTASSRAMVSDLTKLPQDGSWREIIHVGNSGVIEKTR